MSDQTPKLDHLLCAAGGMLAGAWWVKNKRDEAKRSRTEKDDPGKTGAVCNAIRPILENWKPEAFDSEGDYVEDLFDYLARETDVDFDLEQSPNTREGKPDILIDDALAIEVKYDLSKTERDRLIGQTAGYSREWATWIVLIDTPKSRVGGVRRLLSDKGLAHILVFAFW